MKSKLKKFSVGLLSVVGAIFIILFVIGSLISDEVPSIVNNINSLDKELTYAIEDIKISLENTAEEDLTTQGSIDRVQNELPKISKNTEIIGSNVNEIEKELNKLEQLDYEEYNTFIEKLSDSYSNYNSYADSINEVVEEFRKFLNWASHYVKITSYMEDIAKNEELIATYLEIEDYDKVNEILEDTQEKINLAKNEVSEADKIIKFSLNEKYSEILGYYGNYSMFLGKSINYIEDGNINQAEDSLNDAISFAIKASEAIPTESETIEDFGSWYNENIYNPAVLADDYLVEADRAYNDAFEIYNSL